jgi:hypothetical protein
MTRPAGFSQDIADQVIDRIAEGEMLTKVCEDEGMPTKKQFRYWMSSRDELRDAYARARFAWADHWAERIIEISINPAGAVEGDGKVFVDNAQMMWAKHLTDNLKWLVGKYAPRTYGDKPEEIAPPAQGRIGRIERVIIEDKPAQRIVEPPRLVPPNHPSEGMTALDWSLLREIVDTLKSTMSPGDQRAPQEVLSIIRAALLAHFAAQAEASSA